MAGAPTDEEEHASAGRSGGPLRAAQIVLNTGLPRHEAAIGPWSRRSATSRSCRGAPAPRKNIAADAVSSEEEPTAVRGRCQNQENSPTDGIAIQRIGERSGPLHPLYCHASVGLL